jgi:hypothetical protein
MALHGTPYTSPSSSSSFFHWRWLLTNIHLYSCFLVRAAPRYSQLNDHPSPRTAVSISLVERRPSIGQHPSFSKESSWSKDHQSTSLGLYLVSHKALSYLRYHVCTALPVLPVLLLSPLFIYRWVGSLKPQSIRSVPELVFGIIFS